MKGRAEVFRLRSQLDATFARIDSVDPSAFELRSDYARYLGILVSGYLERSIKELAMQCCRRMSSGPALNYAIGQLDWSRNPTLDNLLDLVGQFRLDWRGQLEIELTQERREAIGSVVGLRNAVAHGGSAGFTFERATGYYARIKEVVDYLADLFDPAS